jgi:hypothetical protein
MHECVGRVCSGRLPAETRSRPRLGQASASSRQERKLEDAQKYFSILMTDAVEPGRNFIYANALAVKVDA